VGDGTTHASGVALVAGGAPGGGRGPSSDGRVSYGRARGGWRAMVGQRAARTSRRADWRSNGGRGGWHGTGAGSGGWVSCGRARGGRRSRTRGEFV